MKFLQEKQRAPTKQGPSTRVKMQPSPDKITFPREMGGELSDQADCNIPQISLNFNQ